MLKLEDFGITPGRVTATIAAVACFMIVLAAIGILLYCLFGIGLARIAKKRGEEKEWYAYLPLLRYYTLGKMIKAGEKTKKVFACLLPSILVLKYVLCVISSALMARGAMSLVFAAENIEGSAVDLTSLVSFPAGFYIAALVITLIVSLAAKIILTICYYGAFSGKSTALAIVFTVLTFICCPLGAIFLYVASTEKKKQVNPEENDG